MVSVKFVWKCEYLRSYWLYEQWRSCRWFTGVIGLQTYENKYNENANAFNTNNYFISYFFKTSSIYYIDHFKLFQTVLLCRLVRYKEDCPCHRDERNHWWFSFMKSQDMLMASIEETVIFVATNFPKVIIFAIQVCLSSINILFAG